MKNNLRDILHTFLFVLFFILFLFAHNHKDLLYSDLMWPLALGLLLVVSTLALFLALYRDIRRAALASTFALVLFLSYGHVFEIRGEGNGYWIQHRYLMALWAVLFFGGLAWLWRTKRDLVVLSRGLILVGATLVGLSTLTILRYEFTEHAVADVRLPEIAKKVELEYMPDVYYILPDAYSSELALKKYYNYDNSAFRKALEGRGFYVVPKPRSNYSGTAFSVASFLNIDYLDSLSAGGKVSRSTLNPRTLIANNVVGTFLQKQGYKYIHLGTWWEGDFRILAADENINKGLMPEFVLLLFRKTIAFPFSYNFGYLDDRHLQHERILYQLDEVAKIPAEKAPTFTFFHLGAPHGPLVFKEDGSFLDIPEQELDDENVKNPAIIKKYYPGQLKYVTSRLEPLIDTILKKSEHPPIIIIQSDHGSSLFARSDPEYERNRLKNFTAIYFPEIKDKEGKIHGGRSVAWADITPINTFRLLLNEYFGTDLEYLPDLSYAFSDKVSEHPEWGLIDVTDSVAKDYGK